MKTSNTALISFSAIWAEPLTPMRLKLATLLFDRVYFMSEEHPQWYAAIAEIHGNEANVPLSVLSELREVWTCANPQRNGFSIYGPNDKILSIDTVSHELRQAANSVICGVEENESGYENYKLKIFSLSEILWWREKFPSSTLVGASFVENIIEEASTANPEVKIVPKTVEVGIPDVAKLTFGDIVALRRSEFLQSFRLKYAELSYANEVQRLLDFYYATIEKLVDEVRPHTSKEIAKGILGNLPIPIVNPIGIATSVQDIWKSVKLKREFGWVYFVREMRSKNVS